MGVDMNQPDRAQRIDHARNGSVAYAVFPAECDRHVTAAGNIGCQIA